MKDYKTLQSDTVQDMNLTFIKNGLYHYVNHLDRVCTKGYNSEEQAIKYADLIRFDENTVQVMQNRYLRYSTLGLFEYNQK